MNPLTMTGLEQLQAMAAGQIPPPSIAQTIGMTMSRMTVEHGHAVLTATADERHSNPLGMVHGGFAATVLDSITGCALHSALEAGVGYSTVDLAVKFLRPVPRDVALLAEGRLVHLGRTMATAEGTLKTGDGKLLATATATLLIQRT